MNDSNDMPCVLQMVQEEFEEQEIIPLATMPWTEPGQTYVVLSRPEGALTLGKLVNIMRFTVKEIDPSTGAAAHSHIQRSLLR